MTYFTELEPEGQVAVLVRNGVYQQAPLFTRNGHLFAKVAGGFVRLAANGSTSAPNIRIDSIVTDLPLFHDRFGRLCDASVDGAKAIEPAQAQMLLGGPA